MIIVCMNHREQEYQLDDDDYELLQESNISVPRPKLVSFFSFALFFESISAVLPLLCWLWQILVSIWPFSLKLIIRRVRSLRD